MKIVNLRQGTEQWKTWRASGIGASELAIVLGMSPYMTPKQLWSIKIGVAQAPELDHNPLVIHGKRTEPKARQAAEKWFGCSPLLLPVCASHSQYPFMLSSFDGIDLNPDAKFYNVPVELKCPSEAVWKEVSFYGEQSIHYKLYYCQVQQQLMVCGGKKGYLIFYYQGHTLPFEVKPDLAFQRMALDKSKQFQRCVDTFKSPLDDLDKDMFVPTGQTLIEWETLATIALQLMEAKKQHPEDKQIIRDYMDVKQRLANLTGGYRKGQAAGIQVTNVIQGGSVNYKLRLDAILRYLAERNIVLDESLHEDNFRTREKQHIRISKAKSAPPTPNQTNPNSRQQQVLQPRITVTSIC